MQRFHFISIGGAVMHNMALDMQKKGYQITGSDDDIFEPAKSRLAKAGLLPTKMGWDTNNITSDLDGIILGMHARIDNPELIKAKELQIPI
ncbi:MAG: peptidoglycan synthetase, partial [Bacteroidetes bacterium]|nr:peptidoglycan synthetase [Bacteroidota bacterium]